MKHLLPLLLLFALPLVAAPISIEVPSEQEVSLSLAQEADMAIWRAQRWLSLQSDRFPEDEISLWFVTYAQCQLDDTAPTPLPEKKALDAYILAPGDETSMRVRFRNLSLRDFISSEERETIIRQLVNTQKVLPTGGHWGKASVLETTFSILTLRYLLNQSIPLPSDQLTPSHS